MPDSSPSQRRRWRGLRPVTVERLPLYLRVLELQMEEGRETVSSSGLAALMGLTGESVRRDLWDLRAQGLRGTGYEVQYLHDHISGVVGSQRTWSMAIAGAGNIGSALASYPNLAARGFKVVAIFDNDPERVGREVGGVRVRAVADLRARSVELGIDIGVIAVPARAAQVCADMFVDAGVRALLNFAPVHLSTPDSVIVRYVDLILELQVLGFHLGSRLSRPGV
jgi:redox-sensing transcriptional repressor